MADLEELKKLSEDKLKELVDAIVSKAPDYLALDTAENSQEFIKTRLIGQLKESQNIYGKRQGALTSIGGYINAYETIYEAKKGNVEKSLEMFNKFSKKDDKNGTEIEYLHIIFDESKYANKFKYQHLQNMVNAGEPSEKVEKTEEIINARIASLKQKGLLASQASDNSGMASGSVETQPNNG